MEIQHVPVTALTGRTPSGPTNAYVLGRTRALLIDPANRTEQLDDLLEDVDVAHLAVTHHHADHTGATAEYAVECGATVWARQGREADFEAATGLTPDRSFTDGTEIPTDAGGVTVRDTPGHAPEHVAFTVGAMAVTGDLAVEPGTVVVGHPSGDMRAYLTSLRRVWASDPDQLYPGHGDVITRPRATLERLIAHRLDRERRVLAAVRAGARTVEAITDAAYDKDIAAVRDLAEATVRAHVEKLAAEGRIRWTDVAIEPA